jgi:glutamyl-tRNA reductase
MKGLKTWPNTYFKRRRPSTDWLLSEKRRLVLKTGGSAIQFQAWEQEFRDLDILVSSTAAPHMIITLDKLAHLPARRKRPLFMIDLAMPRDIDPAVQELAGAYLYDLDSLQSMADRTPATRKRESEKCHQLIEHHVKDFQPWIERTQSPNPPAIVASIGGAI